MADEPLLKYVDLGNGPLDGIYFGVGISDGSCLSKKTPLATLSMILCGEHLRRGLGTNGYILLADKHAEFNGHGRTETSQVASEKGVVFDAVLRHLGINNGWDVIRASDIFMNHAYRLTLQMVEESLGDKLSVSDYTKLELADILWFTANKGTDIKLGWVSASLKRLTKDERFFDIYIRTLYPRLPTTFVYTAAGRNLAGAEVPPYIDTRRPYGDPLFMLDEQPSDMKRYMKRMQKPAREYFTNLMRLYEKVIGQLNGETLDEKIMSIYKAIL